MRRLYLLLVVIGGLAFLAVSVLLARAWNAEGNERAAITALLNAEARGDAGALTAQLRGCAHRPACRHQASAAALTLRHRGHVLILQLQPSTGFSLDGTEGVARVAWNSSSSSRPIVQCVEVRRAGDVVQGLQVQLLAISAPIRSDAECPRRVG